MTARLYCPTCRLALVDCLCTRVGGGPMHTTVPQVRAEPHTISVHPDGEEVMRITRSGTYIRVDGEMVRVEDRMIMNEINGSLRETGNYLLPLTFPHDEDVYKKFLRAKTRGNPDEGVGIETRGPVCPECNGVVWHKLDIFAPAVCMYCGHIHGNEVGGTRCE